MGMYAATACLCVFVFVLALDIMGVFSTKNHFPVDGKALAKLLASKGANVIIVARDEAKLNAAIKEISRFHTISADVTSSNGNDRILEEATRWNGQAPDIVWANAGSSHPGLFLDTSDEIMRRQMDLNYWAANGLARSTLKLWTTPSSHPKEGHRHFVITASVVSFIGIAGYSPYSPAKAALRSLADTLRSELNLYNGMRRSKNPEVRSKAPDQDIAIHFVAPATIQSPGYENEERIKHSVTKELEKDDPKQSEEEVAKAALKGLENGGFIVTTQFTGHAMRAAALGPSPRNNWLVDTLFAWLASIIWLFVTPDLEKKVFEYGKMHDLIVKIEESWQDCVIGLDSSKMRSEVSRNSIYDLIDAEIKQIQATQICISYIMAHKSLKDTAKENPTQIGDPVSLKAETSKTEPTKDDRGAGAGKSGETLKEKAEKSLKNNPSALGDPVSLKAETSNSEPTKDDRGARGTGKPKI
ncbi:hypothetical protein MRB53_039576 [Persea americana]|nr:hypothetical protein MRB53_039576 [Persea americana]